MLKLANKHVSISIVCQPPPGPCYGGSNNCNIWYSKYLPVIGHRCSIVVTKTFLIIFWSPNIQQLSDYNSIQIRQDRTEGWRGECGHCEGRRVSTNPSQSLCFVLLMQANKARQCLSSVQTKRKRKNWANLVLKISEELPVFCPSLISSGEGDRSDNRTFRGVGPIISPDYDQWPSGQFWLNFD